MVRPAVKVQPVRRIYDLPRRWTFRYCLTTLPSESFLALKGFFESAPVARRATSALSREAEVGLLLEGGEQARFIMAAGVPEVLPEPARHPDFTLRLPARAVSQLTSLESDDVGEFGVEFFSLVVSKDAASRVRVHIDAPTASLIGHGYLGVLAVGGVKVMGWLLKKGARNPKAAIDRLRGGR